MFDINGIKVNRITYFSVKIKDHEPKGIIEILSYTTVLRKRNYRICGGCLYLYNSYCRKM